MAFSRLVYPIILRFSHYPVVSPLRGRNLLYSLPLSLFPFRFLSLPPCSTMYSYIPRDREEEGKRRGGGIVAKVRYRCRRDTGVARITVTAAPGGWKRPPLARSFAPATPFRRFERHATSRPTSSLWIPFRTRAKVSKKIEGFRKDDPYASRINKWINVLLIRFVPFVFIILGWLRLSNSNRCRVNYLFFFFFWFKGLGLEIQSFGACSRSWDYF